MIYTPCANRFMCIRISHISHEMRWIIASWVWVQHGSVASSQWISCPASNNNDSESTWNQIKHTPTESKRSISPEQKNVNCGVRSAKKTRAILSCSELKWYATVSQIGFFEWADNFHFIHFHSHLVCFMALAKCCKNLIYQPEDGPLIIHDELGFRVANLIGDVHMESLATLVHLLCEHCVTNSFESRT